MLIAYNALTIKHPPTGIPGHVTCQLQALLKHDKKNRYIIFAGGSFNRSLFDLTRAEIIRFPTKGPLSRILLEQFLVPFYLLKYRADLYFSTSFALPFALFFLRKIKAATNVYDLSYLIVPETLPRLTRLYYRLTFPFSFRRANILFSNSNAITKELKKHFAVPAEKIVTAYPALVLSNTGTSNIRKKYLLPEGYILAVGRLEKRKNFLGLLRAFKIYSEKSPSPLPLVIAGFRAYGANEIDAYISENNLKKLVHTPGHFNQEDLLSLYSNADLFVYPSLYEGFGLPILESFLAGTPVITSNTSSMPEAGGGAALYVDPLLPADIAEKIEKLLSDNSLREELVRKGKSRLARFSWEKHAEIVLRAIHTTQIMPDRVK